MAAVNLTVKVSVCANIPTARSKNSLALKTSNAAAATAPNPLTLFESSSIFLPATSITWARLFGRLRASVSIRMKPEASPVSCTIKLASTSSAATVHFLRRREGLTGQRHWSCISRRSQRSLDRRHRSCVRTADQVLGCRFPRVSRGPEESSGFRLTSSESVV